MDRTEEEQQSRACKRATREFNEVVESDQARDGAFIHLRQVDGRWDDLLGKIAGPSNTPYEGGVFLLEVKIPKTYPFNPPKTRFITKVWHPNISTANGHIHLNILKDDWVAGLSLRTLLLSIQGLLSTPTHPDNISPELFNSTAQYWTNVYAGGPIRVEEFEKKVEHLVEMGVDEHHARMVLSVNDWDIGKATEQLDFS